MTYKELLEKLQGLTEKQLQSSVTVVNVRWDEYYPAQFDIVVESSVLDPEHPVILFDD